MKNFFKITVILLAIVQFSCDRAKKTENTLTLSVVSDKTQTQSTEVHPMWGSGTSLPVSTASEINCYAVMVSSLDADPWMHRNSCIVTDGANSSTFYFGPIFGYFPQVKDAMLNEITEFVVNVPSGPQRKILLIGVKTNDITKCLDMTKNILIKSNYSERYIIGEAVVDLFPGQDINSQIKNNWTPSSKWILDGSCVMAATTGTP